MEIIIMSLLFQLQIRYRLWGGHRNARLSPETWKRHCEARGRPRAKRYDQEKPHPKCQATSYY